MTSPAANRTIKVRIDGNARGIVKASADAERAIKGVADETGTLGTVAKQMAAKFAIGFAAVAVAGGVASPAIGAAIAGGIVLGLGAGLAAVGIMAAAQAERVQKAWTGVLDPFKAQLKTAAQPLEGVLVGAANHVRSLLADVGAEFAAAIPTTAAPLDRFFTRLREAAGELLPAIRPLTESFNAILDDLGPRLPGVFENIASGLTKMADAIKENPEAISAMIEGIGALVGAIITLIGWFVTVNGALIDFGGTVRRTAVDSATAFLTFTAHVLNGIRSMLSSFFGFQIGALEAMRSVASALGLPTGPIDAAIRNLQGLRSTTDTQLQAMINKTYQWISAINAIPRTVSVNYVLATSSTIPGGGRLGSQGVRAAGGATSPWSMYRVNERGPEMYSVRGKDYLMTGSSGGRVTANERLGGDMTVVVRVGEREFVGMIEDVVDEKDRKLRSRVTAGYRR